MTTNIIEDQPIVPSATGADDDEGSNWPSILLRLLVLLLIGGGGVAIDATHVIEGGVLLLVLVPMVAAAAMFFLPKPGATVVAYGLFLAITLSAGLGYYHFIAKPRQEARAEAREAAIDKLLANPEAAVEPLFRAWSTSTIEDGQVIEWKGIDATLIYVSSDRRRDAEDGGSPSSIGLWAKSPGGRFFKLEYLVRGNPPRLQLGLEIPEQWKPTDVVRMLRSEKRLDLIDKLGLPKKPA